MLATIMPFLCMGTGLLMGSKGLSEKIYKVVDWLTNLSLIVLMVTIGGNVGTNEAVIAEIGTVGLNCLFTCLAAIVGSVIFCLITAALKEIPSIGNRRSNAGARCQH